MQEVRRANERGLTEQEGMTCHHTFSFADFQDPDWMGFGCLRVINQDTVAAGKKLSAHPHQNIEILTYVTEGKLRQIDSTQTTHEIKAGQCQLISAGTGILHSEESAAKGKPLQRWEIWMFPHAKGLAPSYQLLDIDHAAAENGLFCLASPDGRNDSMIVNQNLQIFLGKLQPERLTQYAVADQRRVWLQLLHGSLRVNDELLEGADGMGLGEVSKLVIQAEQASSFMLFDMK